MLFLAVCAVGGVLMNMGFWARPYEAEVELSDDEKQGEQDGIAMNDNEVVVDKECGEDFVKITHADGVLPDEPRTSIVEI